MVRVPLQTRLFALLVVAMLLSAALAAGLSQLLDSAVLGFSLALLFGLPLALWVSRVFMAPLHQLLRALSGLVASYRDGDFSLSLAVRRNDELGELIATHNALGASLREQRQHLVQRELLLDTVMQHSPVSLVLVDAHRRVVYANLAARHLLNAGASLAGLDFDALIAQAPTALREAIERGADALIPLELEGSEETLHLSQRGFLLQARPHRLYLLRLLTRELSRQEVATWKKLIRVLSHELNNSLAPISSMAHTGAELVRRGQTQRLPEVFAGIHERVSHLHAFVQDYASFARLPAPRPQAVEWASFFAGLALAYPHHVVGALPTTPGWFDPAQLEQALINLLKNAHEAGGAAEAVELAVSLERDRLRLEVSDRGPGMSEAVLAQALLPFYSTKRSGTGVGLALVREIVEAHGGTVSLSNRVGGGLTVSLLLPQAPNPAGA